MSETSPQRQIMRAEERLPIVERILREAGRPLTRQEIVKLAGWPESGNQAVGRLFAAYPSHFRRTRGNVKKNERWELAPSRPAEEPLAPPAEAIAAVLTPAPPVVTEPFEPRLLDVLQGMVDEFHHSGYNPNCAVYLIGRLEEALKQLPATPASS
ncbi:MAG: hypothetical protein HYT39_04185 [Candidatus Sungbacteria bacterium]|nr:hypothetical protein [Candidatus Sungbacteria bacterium]